MTDLKNLPTEIPIFPLSNFIIFPGMTVPLNIFEPRYIQMVDDSIKTNRTIGMIQPKRTGDLKNPDLYNSVALFNSYLSVVALYVRTSPSSCPSVFTSSNLEKRTSPPPPSEPSCSIVLALNLIMADDYQSNADINSDYTIDILDIVQLGNMILN